MRFVNHNGISRLESELLNATGVVHGFGTKDMGVEVFARLCGITEIQATDQVHGSDVHVVSAVSGNVLKGDGFITTEYGVILHIRTADCLPILWSDPLKGVIGAVHAGWRGLASGVIGKSLELASAKMGILPSDVRCAIGPAIGPDCYEVGLDVIEALAKTGHDISRIARAVGHEKWLLNVCACAVAELERSGVPSSQIDVAGICTHCDADRFHSYRRVPNVRGRQVSFILIPGAVVRRSSQDRRGFFQRPVSAEQVACFRFPSGRP